jgi:hypothetical protein
VGKEDLAPISTDATDMGCGLSGGEESLAKNSVVLYLRSLPEAFLTMPASASSVESTWTIQRYGQDGLALLSYGSIGLTTPAVQVLLRGPFIALQELSVGTAATLSSSSASTIAHGSGSTTLTLTETNFLPGVAVTWNGSYRTTTVVSSTQVTVAILASDLASTGTASLVATNPGASASNTLKITINQRRKC